MSKVDLSKFNNDWYHPGNPIKRLFWYGVNAMVMMNPLNPFSGVKKFFLKVFGAKIESGVVIKPGVNIKYPWNLEIGKNSWIGEKVWIDNLGKVIIGANVCVSQEAMLLCGNHDYRKEAFDLIVGEITLKEGAWVGAKSVVCPNVTVHEYAILTVGSVATQNLEAGKIYQGNPAQFVRERKFK